MYDVIGDIHGHAEALRRLLLRLGYVEGADGFRHPGRTAVFLGDFIDRGPAIRQVLATVRPMVASGAALAVMGNHEFNAISFHTAHPTVVPGWLRERSLRHIRQYLETIRQIPTDAELEDHIAWFTTLPLRLELDGLRIVHACWDEPAFAVIDAAARDTGGVNAVFFARATETDDALFDAVESVLKGPEAALPPDTAFLDSDGQRRRHARVRWYLADAARRPWRQAVFAFDERIVAALPDTPMDAATAAVATRPYPADAPPVLFGHYWMPGDAPSAPLAPNVACLDTSVAARGGRLTAYRWDGEAVLDAGHFVSEPARAGASLRG